MATNNRPPSSQENTRDADTPESSSDLPRDSSGALPKPDDREAISSMRAYMIPELRNMDSLHSGLFYPSTVRTALIPELRAPWNWMWLYYCPFKDQNPMRYATWLSDLQTFLNEESCWAGLVEMSLSAMTVRIFLAALKGRLSHISLMAKMVFHTAEHELGFTVKDYSKKRGPAYYLRDVRYPCFRIGGWRIDDAWEQGDYNLLMDMS
jgi:hypothetical protein